MGHHGIVKKIRKNLLSSARRSLLSYRKGAKGAKNNNKGSGLKQQKSGLLNCCFFLASSSPVFRCFRLSFAPFAPLR